MQDRLAIEFVMVWRRDGRETSQLLSLEQTDTKVWLVRCFSLLLAIRVSNRNHKSRRTLDPNGPFVVFFSDVALRHRHLHGVLGDKCHNRKRMLLLCEWYVIHATFFCQLKVKSVQGIKRMNGQFKRPNDKQTGWQKKKLQNYWKCLNFICQPEFLAKYKIISFHFVNDRSLPKRLASPFFVFTLLFRTVSRMTP